MSPELLHPTEVKKEWEDLISGAIKPLAKKHGLEHTAWYHDGPFWYLGEIQLNLVRDHAVELLEIHKGENNHLALQVEKLDQEALQSVLECLIVTTE